MVIFVWGARLYVAMSHPPDDALEVAVVGQQWMWKFQYPEGQRAINELHVPVGHPVRLTMTSQDVIHSFYVPAFRIKMDVVPGRYTTTWFEATRPGEYHLFCAEYCGTVHAGMGGRVVVLPPAQYQQWLSGGRDADPMARVGQRLFQELGCEACHRAGSDSRGPSLRGVFGTPVQLQNGEVVRADETYIRESILNPRAKVVAGYPPIMPAFQGQISEEGLLQLIAYIKSLASTTRKHAHELHTGDTSRALSQCGLRREIVALDHRPQAHCAVVFGLDHLILFSRRRVCCADAPRTRDSTRRSDAVRDL
jgi:cytochrome c oxidase subunit 2